MPAALVWEPRSALDCIDRYMYGYGPAWRWRTRCLAPLSLYPSCSVVIGRRSSHPSYRRRVLVHEYEYEYGFLCSKRDSCSNTPLLPLLRLHPPFPMHRIEANRHESDSRDPMPLSFTALYPPSLPPSQHNTAKSFIPPRTASVAMPTPYPPLPTQTSYTSKTKATPLINPAPQRPSHHKQSAP